MKTYRVTLEDGNTITTSMNADIDQAKAYYIGQSFNFGDTDSHPKDKMVKAVSVVEL